MTDIEPTGLPPSYSGKQNEYSLVSGQWLVTFDLRKLLTGARFLGRPLKFCNESRYSVVKSVKLAFAVV